MTAEQPKAAEPHVHKYDRRVKRKAPLYSFEYIEGQLVSSLIGHDYLLMRKCKCGDVETYDLVRQLI